MWRYFIIVDDLAGHLLRNGEWAHLNLPAIATSDENVRIGENEWHSLKQGEALHPDFENLEKLEEAKRNLGRDWKTTVKSSHAQRYSKHDPAD